MDVELDGRDDVMWRLVATIEIGHRAAREGERVGVVAGERVGDARHPRVQIAAPRSSR